MEPIIHILTYNLKSALVLMYCGSVAFEHIRRYQSNFNLFHFSLRDRAFGVFRVGFHFESCIGPHKDDLIQSVESLAIDLTFTRQEPSEDWQWIDTSRVNF